MPWLECLQAGERGIGSEIGDFNLFDQRTPNRARMPEDSRNSSGRIRWDRVFRWPFPRTFFETHPPCPERVRIRCPAAECFRPLILCSRQLVGRCPVVSSHRDREAMIRGCRLNELLNEAPGREGLSYGDLPRNPDAPMAPPFSPQATVGPAPAVGWFPVFRGCLSFARCGTQAGAFAGCLVRGGLGSIASGRSRVGPLHLQSLELFPKPYQ